MCDPRWVAGWVQGFANELENRMSVFDKAKHQAEQWVGKAKEATGKATGNEEMENSGKRDEVEGEAKETGQDLKDKAAGAVEDAKKKFRGGENQ